MDWKLLIRSRRGDAPAYVFAVLAGVLGVGLVFLTPLFQVPDEPVHAYRAYQVSEGIIAAETRDGVGGGEVPVSLAEAVLALRAPENDRSAAARASNLRLLRAKPLDPSARIFLPFQATAVYSPVAYLPHATGFVVARLLHVSAPSLCYIGRLSNLLAWVAMVFAAIRITPIYRWLLVFLALLPMSLFEAASLSADATTNGLAYLTIALFLRLALDPSRAVRKREIAALFVTCCLVALAKPGYVPIVVLFFLIPGDKFDSRKQQFALFALLTTGAILATVVWSSFGRVAQHVQLIAQLAPWRDVLDPVQQVQYILSHPVAFAATLLRTLAIQFENLRDHFIGVLGWLDVPLPRASVNFGSAMILFFGLRDSRCDINLDLRSKAILAIYAIATVVLIMTSEFVTWSPVGAAQIDGMQGRYLIPVAPAAFALLYNRRLRWIGRDRDLGWIAVASVLVLFITAAVALTHRYYDGN